MDTKTEIHHKKLLEQLASTTNLIPRFNCYGKFSFVPIYNKITGMFNNNNFVIKKEDVISFDYLHSEIEEIVTRIEFKYNFNYGSDSFNKEINIEEDVSSWDVNVRNYITVHDIFPDYNLSHYNLS